MRTQGPDSMGLEDDPWHDTTHGTLVKSRVPQIFQYLGDFNWDFHFHVLLHFDWHLLEKYRVNGFELLLKQQEYELKAWCKHLQLFSEKLLPSLSAWLKGQDDEDDWVQRDPSTYLDNLINILNVGRRRRRRRRPLDDVPHHRREHGLGLRLGLGLTHRFEYLVRVGKRQSTLFIDATGELQSEHTVPAQACTPEPLDGIRAAAS